MAKVGICPNYLGANTRLKDIDCIFDCNGGIYCLWKEGNARGECHVEEESSGKGQEKVAE